MPDFSFRNPRRNSERLFDVLPRIVEDPKAEESLEVNIATNSVMNEDTSTFLKVNIRRVSVLYYS